MRAQVNEARAQSALATRTCARRWSRRRSPATRDKNCYFREKYYRLKARRGHKRAIVAVAHKILVAIYHMLSSDTPYRELGADYLERLELERLKLNLVRRLERLGFHVNLEPRRA